MYEEFHSDEKHIFLPVSKFFSKKSNFVRLIFNKISLTSEVFPNYFWFRNSK